MGIQHILTRIRAMAKLFNEQEKQRLNFASSVKVAQLIFKAQMNKG